MRSLRKTGPALAGLLLAAAVVVGGAGPASAISFGGQATTLVGGAPLVQATCANDIAANASQSGTSTLGTVSTNGSAQCNATNVRAQGTYGLSGAAPNYTFDANCQNLAASTGGGVEVPAGTTINGGSPLATRTTVTTLNAIAVYPTGQTATLNTVSTGPDRVVRTAITITAGTGTGAVIGRAVCGSPIPYPLAVDAPSAGSADVALPAVSGDAGSSNNRMLYVGGALALVALVQLAVGRTVVRRRRDATGS